MYWSYFFFFPRLKCQLYFIAFIYLFILSKEIKIAYAAFIYPPLFFPNTTILLDGLIKRDIIGLKNPESFVADMNWGLSTSRLGLLDTPNQACTGPQAALRRLESKQKASPNIITKSYLFMQQKERIILHMKGNHINNLIYTFLNCSCPLLCPSCIHKFLDCSR